ncbi:flippase [Paenibacillus cisolokensis]|uniref:flippase n=1 Tax=Paenibacillus cisolokensis TaxID=1658519 RepID=UPI003D2D84E3
MFRRASGEAAGTAPAPRAQGASGVRGRSPIARTLAKGGSISFLVNTSGMGLALLMQIALARMLGVDGYGIFSFVTTVVTFLVFPAKLGFDTTIVRLTASYRAVGDWPGIKGLLRRGNQIGLILSLIVAAGGMAAVWLGRDGMTGEQLATYIAGLAGIPLLTLATLRQSALQGLKDVLFAQMPEKIMRPVLTIALLALCAYGFGMTADAGLAMLCFGVSVAVTYVVGAFVLKVRIGRHTRQLAPRYETREWVRLSVSLMINAGMYLLLGQLSVLLIGFMQGETASGLFSAAVRLGTLVAFALTAINMTAAPLLSETYAKGDRKQMQQVCTTTGRAGFLFAAVVFAVFALLGRPLLGLFGEEFRDAYPALMLLAGGHLIKAFCGQSGTLTTMTGHQKVLTKVLSLASVLNVALCVLLIPPLGITGAALATSVSGVAWNVVMVVIIWRRFGIQTFAWAPPFMKTKDKWQIQEQGAGEKRREFDE